MQTLGSPASRWTAVAVVLFAVARTAVAQATVNDQHVNVRRYPYVGETEVVRQLNRGDKVIVLAMTRNREVQNGRNDYWYNVQTEDNREGWVFGAYLQLDQDYLSALPGRLVIDKSQLNYLVLRDKIWALLKGNPDNNDIAADSLKSFTVSESHYGPPNTPYSWVLYTDYITEFGQMTVSSLDGPNKIWQVRVRKTIKGIVSLPMSVSEFVRQFHASQTSRSDGEIEVNTGMHIETESFFMMGQIQGDQIVGLLFGTYAS